MDYRYEINSRKKTILVIFLECLEFTILQLKNIAEMWKTVNEFNLVLLTLKKSSKFELSRVCIYQPNLLITKILHYFLIVYF